MAAGATEIPTHRLELNLQILAEPQPAHTIGPGKINRNAQSCKPPSFGLFVTQHYWWQGEGGEGEGGEEERGGGRRDLGGGIDLVQHLILPWASFDNFLCCSQHDSLAIY